MKSFYPALLSLAICWPVRAANFVLGPERPIADFSVGVGDWRSEVRSIVRDGDGYLVFWLRTPTEPRNASADFVATRATRDGRLVGEPITLFASAVKQFGFADAVRTPAGDFLLSWTSTDRLFIAFASADLREVSEPVPLTTDPSPVAPSGIACNKSRCLVVSSRRFNYGDTVYATVIENRTVVASRLLRSSIQLTDVAASNDTFLISYTLYDGSSSRRVMILDGEGNGMRDTGESGRQTCVANGHPVGYALACARGRDVVVSMLDPNGEEFASRVVASVDANHHAGSVAVAAGETSLMVMFGAVVNGAVITGAVLPQVLYGAHLSRDLEMVGMPFSVTEAENVSWAAAAESNGSDFLLAWNHSDNSIGNINSGHVAAISPTGGIIAGRPLRTGPLTQAGHSIASSIFGDLVVWSEHDVGETGNLIVAHVDTNDRLVGLIRMPLDPGRSPNVTAVSDGRDYVLFRHDFPIASGPTTIDISFLQAITGQSRNVTQVDGHWWPRMIASTRSAYFVPYQKRKEGFRILKVAPTGDVVNDFSPAFAGTIAATEDRIFVAWTDLGTYIAILDHEGRVLVQPRRVSTTRPWDMRASTNGDHFLLLAAVGRGIYSTRFDPEGRRLDLANQDLGRVIAQPSATAASVLDVAVAANGWMVFWRPSGGVARATFIDRETGLSSAPFEIEDGDSRFRDAAESFVGNRLSLLYERREVEHVRRVVTRHMTEVPAPRRRAAGLGAVQ